MSEVKLKLNWVNYETAVFACKNWHYSKSIPVGKLIKIGIWEDEIFRGVIIYSRGANFSIGMPFNLNQLQVCELSRIAMSKHITPVTRIVSISLKMLKKFCPGLKLVVSYADFDQGHEGKIYRAGNWIYAGLKQEGKKSAYIFKGKKVHPRTINSKYSGKKIIERLKNIDPKASVFITKGKHKFLWVFDKSIREDIIKRCDNLRS